MTTSKKFSPSKPADLLGRIKEVFPDISWSKYRYLNEGWDHEVIILDEKLVFRFPNDSEYLNSLKIEIEVLHGLSPLVSSVKMPNYSYVEPGYSFAGYQFLEGRALKLEYVNSLPSTSIDVIIKKLSEFLSILHKAIQQNYDFNAVPKSDMAETQSEDKILSEKHLKPILTIEDYHFVETILDETDAILSQALPLVLLHGDIYSDHLLWNDQVDELSVIDFSDMNLGDPAIDFAELYEYGEEFVQRVYKYYTGPKDDSFLYRSKIYQKWVGVFMMVDHFIHHKTSFETARDTFERTKHL